MAKNPFFSIISVTLNNLKGLKKTHESVQLQSFAGYEWQVIDGNSEDKTISYLESVRADYLSEPDEGLYNAMNKGIERAKGAYLWFLNAGDALPAPDTLEKLAALITEQKTPPDFVYGDAFEDALYKPARSHEKVARGMFTHHQAMLYRRSALCALRYDEHYKIAADYDFTCRFLARAKNMLYVPFPLCIFESGGLSQQNARTGRCEQFAIRRKLGLVSAPENNVIYVLQMALWTLRRLMPRVYWRVKSSGNTRRGFVQT